MNISGGKKRSPSAPADASEAGAAAMSLVVTAAILLLAFAVFVGVRMSKATDEASGLQAAADAAALAGAQSVVEDAPGQIVSALVNGQVIPGNLGQTEAADFASRNDATLVSYEYIPSQDRIRVTVRSNDVLESGRREEGSAAAKVGMPFTGCDTTTEPDSPSPTTSSSPNPSGSSTSSSPNPSGSSTSSPSSPPPVEDVSDTLECGGLELPVRWEWDEDDGWDFDSHGDASLIKNLGLEPALVE